ncbi:MAG: tol-pal system protein YbgF [Pseudomonadota bacterium]
MTFLSKLKFDRKAWEFPGLLALMVMMAISPALAQTDWEMSNRVQRLENEIETLSRAIYRGETPPPGSLPTGGAGGNTADLEIRLQQIENEMRDLRGALEQQAFETRQVKEQLERVTSDLELRMNDLENKRGASLNAPSNSSSTRYTTLGAGSNSSDSGAASAGQGGGYQWESQNSGGSGQLGSLNTSSSGNDADIAAATYDNAFAMVKNRKYDAAEKEFEVFLRDYPSHPLTGNAKYWLGETHYVRGNFERAARIFAEGYKEFPKGSKAADNLLKLGLSLDALGKRNDACVALGQLKKENPTGAAPVLRRADQEMSRLNCSS